MEEVGTTIVDPGTGWGKHTDISYVIQGGGSGSPSLPVGDMGDDPPPPPVPGSISQLCCMRTHCPPTPASVIRNLGLPASWGGIGGGGSGAGGGLCHAPSEHCCTVHINTAPVRDLFRYGEYSSIIRTDVLVRTGGGGI